MAFSTGFCASKSHDRCLFVAVNGTQAYDRYVLCSCSCHEGSPASLELLLERAPGPVAAPLSPTWAEFCRYVDTLNVALRPANDAVAGVGEDGSDAGDS